MEAAGLLRGSKVDKLSDVLNNDEDDVLREDSNQWLVCTSFPESGGDPPEPG